MSLVILSAADRLKTPWLNGGGVTSEIAIFPEGSDITGFEWRLSIAQVSGQSEFSIFEGVDRTIGILGGSLDLDFAHGELKSLSQYCRPYRFDGGAQCVGTPVIGPVTDLNLMTRRGRASGQMYQFSSTRISVTADYTWVIAAMQTRLIVGDREHRLSMGDAAYWRGACAAPVRLAGQGYVVEIL